jgi:glucose-1-phosphate adenylyltransferase
MSNLLVLAAGMSSRMKKNLEGIDANSALFEQANSLPKGMIGVGKGGRPFLDYQLYNAAKGGFKEIGLVLNEKDTVTKAYYESQMAKNATWGLKIKFAIQLIPADRIKPLGTADAVMQGLEQLPEWKGQKFTACNSDNLYSEKVFNLMATNLHPAGLISYNSEGLGFDYEKVKNCAILFEDANEFLIDLIEKPTDNEVDECKKRNGRLGISMNIFNMEYEQGMAYMTSQPLNQSRNEKEMPEALNRIAKDFPGTVKAFHVSEFMPDLTAKADLAEVQAYLLKEFSEI